MTNPVTQEAIEAAAQRRIRVVTNLDLIISQAKIAKKHVGMAGGNRRIRENIAALQCLIGQLDKELNQ